MKARTITISRQYGSGGHEVAKKLSEALGLPCYDNEVISLAAKESGAQLWEFQMAENLRDTNFIYNLSMIAPHSDIQEEPYSVKLFRAQSEAMAELAGRGPAVFDQADRAGGGPVWSGRAGRPARGGPGGPAARRLLRGQHQLALGRRLLLRPGDQHRPPGRGRSGGDDFGLSEPVGMNAEAPGGPPENWRPAFLVYLSMQRPSGGWKTCRNMHCAGGRGLL